MDSENIRTATKMLPLRDLSNVLFHPRGPTKPCKIKNNKAPYSRSHPYKVPVKIDPTPVEDKNGVLVYKDSPRDPKSGALAVLSLTKVSNLGDKESVLLCRQTKHQTTGFHKQFVLKFFPRDSESFVRERQALSCINHPNILAPLSFRTMGTASFTVLKFCSKGSLATHIGKLLITDIVRYFIKIANALLYLHNRNVFHQDLRPENIMIDEHDNPMIADFGMSDTLPPRPGRSETRGASRGGDVQYKRHYGARVSTFFISLLYIFLCLSLNVFK